MSEGQSPLDPAWLESLQNSATYTHPVAAIDVAETHISWVALTGDWAYKLKKPVDFGFVDFTTLALRLAACHEEVRLNKRTAPDLYDSVVPLTHDQDGYRFGGTGPVVEYAVRMRQFAQEDLLDQRLGRGTLTEESLDVLAHEVASLHLHAAVAPVDSSFGNPTGIHKVVQACLDVLAKTLLPSEMKSGLSSLDSWTNQEFDRLKRVMVERKEQGHVRECHGDLHLGNLVMFRGKPTLFDCLEFNPELRWIDVVCDVAFLVMDLIDRKAEPFAWRVLNEWLQQTGDYPGLRLLKYYLTYRALVRAKVAALRLHQTNLTEREIRRQSELLQSYLNLAEQMTRSNPQKIILMHGVSGCGKSFVARKLVSFLGAVRIRSDVERKRLLGNWPALRKEGVTDKEMYSPAATVQTYRRLHDLTREVIECGYSAVVDAAFLRQSDRQLFVSLAEELGVSIRIVHCTAPDEVLKSRIQQRLSQGHDPSDANLEVLDRQQVTKEELTTAEQNLGFSVNTDADDLNLVFRQHLS